MRLRLIRSALAILLAVAGASPVLAQRTTGTIQGTVTDESGAVLPGVTVTLKSPAVQGTPSTVTTGSGAYRFPSLPPGEYTLVFELTGFATFNREGIVITTGNIIEIPAVMKVSTLAETITVSGESPVVDTVSNQVNTTYTKEMVENLPIKRFAFFDLFHSAPGVSLNNQRSDHASAFGSGTSDNQWALDGVDLGASVNGTPWAYLNGDIMEEAQVLSLGAPAEYGNIMGAVFNVVTRQGGNEFHGDVNYYIQHDSITARNTKDSFDGGLPYHREKFQDFTVQVGGPIKRDKLWFFGSYQFNRDQDSQPGTDPNFPVTSNNDRIFVKLSSQVTTNNKIAATFHTDFYDYPSVGSITAAASTRTVQTGQTPAPGLSWTSVLSNKTYFEARYAGFYNRDHSHTVVPSQSLIGTWFLDLDTGEETGAPYFWYDGDINKTSINTKVSHYAEDFMGGNHDVKMGVQYVDAFTASVYGYNDAVYTYGSSPAYGYTQIPFHIGGRTKGIGVFADDTFTRGPVTINLGLRFDYNKAGFQEFPILDRAAQETGQSSAKVDKLFAWRNWSPRIGLTYKLGSQGRTVLKAHYGRYYRGILTGEFGDLSPSVPARFLFSGNYDGAGNPTGLELASDNSNRRVDPDYQSPYTDQFIVGGEYELIADLGLSVYYVHKKGERSGAWRDVGGRYRAVTYVDDEGRDATGDRIRVLDLVNDPEDRLFELTNPGSMFSRYNGVNLQLTKRMSKGWQMLSALTLSKSTGRLGSSFGGPNGTQSSAAGTFGQNPNDYLNTDGRLRGDRPVNWKNQIVYEPGWGLSISANFQHFSGKPWGRKARVPGLALPTIVRVETMDGSRRLETWNLLDLRLSKRMTLTGSTRVEVFGDILNLTNSDANESIQSELGTSSAFGLPDRIISPRRLMLGAKFKF